MKKFNKFSAILPLFTLLIGVLFGLSFYFTLHPQLETPTSAATVTESFKIGDSSWITYSCSVTYDNTYGTIESVTGDRCALAGLASLTIDTSLNSGYSWSASSCTITIIGHENTSINVQLTRNNNEWFNNDISTSANFAGAGIRFTFPFEDLVEREVTTYNISYNLNGGSYGNSHPTSYNTSTSQQTITISNPTRAGYTFSSWSISRSSSGGSSPYFSGTTLYIPANSYGNITLTANWTARSYTITVNANGGNISGSPPTSYSTSASAQSYTIANPTRDYYNFTGWTLTRGGTYGGNSPTISNGTLSIPANSYGNITLTANWEIQKFNLTFRSNNTGLGYVTPAYESSPQNALASYSSTATPTHPLAEFLWWTDENGSIISYEETITIPSLTEDTTCIAVFRTSGASVSARLGGEARFHIIEIDDVEYIHLSAIAFAGYEFAGWTAQSSSGESIDLSTYGSTCDIPFSQIEGAIIIANFTAIDSTNHNPNTDNSNGEFE